VCVYMYVCIYVYMYVWRRCHHADQEVACVFFFVCICILSAVVIYSTKDTAYLCTYVRVCMYI
jgi:hypothetical protein